MIRPLGVLILCVLVLFFGQVVQLPVSSWVKFGVSWAPILIVFVEVAVAGLFKP
jgi:hypothetical protein